MDSSSSSARLGRRFLTVWAGQTASAIGSTASGVGVGVYAFVETGNAAWLGVLAALGSAPYVLAAPFMPVVDRFTRKSVMLAGDTFAAVGPAFALVAALAGQMQMWMLAVMAFVGGVGTALQQPAAAAAVPLLASRQSLGRANALSQLGPAVGIVVGPVVATPLVGWWGIEAILLVDVATFAIAVATTGLVAFDEPPIERADGMPQAGWAPVWAWLRGTGRPFAVLMVVGALVNFFLAWFNVSLIALATDVGGTSRAGIVLGAVGVALVVGSLVATARPAADDRVGVFAFGLIAAALGCLVTAARPNLALLIVGAVIAVGVLPAVNAVSATLYQERVPAAIQGRVFGLRFAASRSLDPIGSVVCGVLVAHVFGPLVGGRNGVSSALGDVFGGGFERGPAVALAVTALSLAALGLWLARSPIRTVLRASPDSPAGPDAVAPEVEPARVRQWA